MIMQHDKQAFTLLDMCLKLYKQLDPHNTQKFKCLAALTSLLHRNGDAQSAQKVHDSAMKVLKTMPDAYELVFATRNYGFLLANEEKTRLEGQDLIAAADRMQKTHPYWAERKMWLFVPVTATLSDDQYEM